MKKYVAAIDAGTGGVRCVICDGEGNAVSQDYRELTTVYTPDGRAEQDPIQLMRSAQDAVKGALVRGDVDPAAILGVSVTGTQTTFVPVDRDGNFLCNMLVWQDARGTEMFPWIRGCLAGAGMSEADLYRRTLRPLDALVAGAKLLWLRENQPELYRRIHKLANPQALLLRALGAREVTIDPTDAGWWLSHDGVTLKRDPQLLELFGLIPTRFPTLRPVGARVGRVSAEAAGRTGLRAGTPLFQGAVDQCCAALGAGNDGREDLGTLCMGTAGVLMTYSRKPVPDPLRRAYVLHYPTGGYVSEYAVPVAASAFRWVRDVLYPPRAFGGEEIYARMDGEATAAPAGCGGVTFIPLLAGSIYPRADASIRGGWLGVSLSTDRAALVRSALEGVCYEMRQVMEAGERRFKAIRLLGGAARSELWCQMQADVYGCPVETLEAREASALGAAMIAAVGVGMYRDLRAAVAAMTRVKRRYEPNGDSVERYDAGYRAWLECLEALTPRAFPALAALRR